MKKYLMTISIGVTACVFILGAAAVAQDARRYVEFSIAGSAQAYVYEGETCHYLNLPARVGGFVTPNLLLELEGIVTVWDEVEYGETEAGYIISLNGSYNQAVTERLMPFVLLGVGFSSNVPFANSVAFYGGSRPKPTVLNAGTGMKFLFSPMAALRVEYRLQDFSGEKTISTYYGSYVYKVDVTVHSIFFGVSLFI